MGKQLSEEYIARMAQMLWEMGISEETALSVGTAIETEEELLAFLDILSESNYEMTSEEVYQAMVEALEKTVAL